MSSSWRAMIERRCGSDPETGTRALQVWSVSAGRPLIEVIAESFGCHPDALLVDQVSDDFYRELGAGDPTPVDGATEALNALYAAGAPLYLSTGSYRPAVDAWLGLLGWNRFFRVVCPSSRLSPKGNDHYRRFITDFGASPQEFAAQALTIGDGIFDMRFGLEQGIALRAGYAPATEAGLRRDERLITAGANLILRDLRQIIPVLEHADPLSDRRWRAASAA